MADFRCLGSECRNFGEIVGNSLGSNDGDSPGMWSEASKGSAAACKVAAEEFPEGCPLNKAMQAGQSLVRLARAGVLDAS